MQLHMVLAAEEVAEPQAHSMPAGYHVREFRYGDEFGVLRVLALVGFDDWELDKLRAYLQEPERPIGTRVAMCRGKIVGVAFASRETPVPPVGRLDYVAVDPEHQGQGLGYCVCRSVLDYLGERAYPSIVLTTDDFRLAAIKTYLHLGFRPKIIRADMPDRWRKILRRLGWSYDPAWLDHDPPLSLGGDSGARNGTP